MKTLLLWVAIIVVCIGAWVFVSGSRVAEEEWPAGLGKLDVVPKRYPPAPQSAGATTLAQLASKVGIELRPDARRKPLRDSEAPRVELYEYVRRQLERAGDEIDAPPPAVEQWLAANAAALDAVRDHLLGGAPIVWESDLTGGAAAPIPNLTGHVHLQRVLVARAFDKARKGDARAWDELRASRELNRGLHERPELVSTLIAVASARLANAAARKMPLPAPAWLAETFAYDYEMAMARAYQAEAWMMLHRQPGPFRALRSGRDVESLRRVTADVLRMQACDATSPQFEIVRASFTQPAPNMLGAWERVLRFRAEREATERVLQIRSGQQPQGHSWCSDGSWDVTPSSIKFTRDVKVAPPGVQIPLEYARR